MPKRYVFWRKPTGQPSKKNDAQFAPTALLRSIGESATVNPNGSISRPFPGGYDNLLPVHSAIVIIGPDGNELNEQDTWSISSAAIDTVVRHQGSGKPIAVTEFLKYANNAAVTFYRQPVVDYVLLTNLSIKSLPANRIRIRGCEITSVTDRRKYVSRDSVKYGSRQLAFAGNLKSTNCLNIKVRTSGRSVCEATDKALDALNLLRGLWTVFDTYGTFIIRMGSTTQKPIGVIHTGPIHTLHLPSGLPAVDSFWYESGYSGDRDLFKPRGDWKRLDRLRQRAIRRMRNCSFGAEVERLVMRYAEALDQSNLDVAFVYMWSILEKMTDTIGASYDETIKRAAFVFKDAETAKEKLEYLRTRRNLYVHAARSSSDGNEAAYMVKSFVDPHLIHLIFNTFGVDSIAEYGNFLTLPTSLSALQRRRELITAAIRAQKLRKSS